MAGHKGPGYNMGGLTFLFTGFLAAGAVAAALPVVIHMLLRRRARVVEIGSVRFLQAVIRQHTRRRRIRQWLLLLLRVLAVLLLSALFARPYLDRSKLEGLNREVVLLVDRSASMQTEAPGGGTLFDAARNEALSEFDRLDDNVAVHFALFDADGATQVDADGLGAANAGDGATDYAAALAYARDVLTLSGRPNRDVVLFSDMQQSGLDRGVLTGFPADVDLTVRDVGRDTAQNLAIEDAQATVVEIRPQVPIVVSARLLNAGALPAKGVKVVLRLDGPQAVREDRVVDLRGGERASVDFPLELTNAGLYRGEVALDIDDDLPLDDRRYLAFEARHPDRVLLVDGQPGRSVYGNETYYLETALRLAVPLADEPPRSYEVERIVWDAGEGFPDLTGYAALVMANIARFSDEDGRRLRAYVAAGGNVAIFTGDRTSPAVVRAFREAGVAPGEIETAPLAGRRRVDAWEKQHPIFAPFADPQYGDLRRLAFGTMHELKDLDQGARVVLRAGGQPLMVESRLGSGLVLFVATAADRDWSDWPQDRLYVPLVRQMMAYLTGQLGERRRVRDEIAAGGQPAGIDQTEERCLVRNVDPRESLLRRVSEEEFRESLALPPPAAAPNVAAAALAAPAGAERPNERWTAVLWMLFVVLAVELLLASRTHA